MSRLDALVILALLVFMFLCVVFGGRAYGQNPSLTLPNAPSATDRNPKELEASKKPRRLWSDVKFRTNQETLHNKSMWAFDGILVASEAFKAEMSTHQGVCVEGGEGLPPHPTRWQLYRANLPEEAFGITWAFFVTKVKMPRWLMFSVEVYPVQSDIRNGLAWRNCWK